MLFLSICTKSQTIFQDTSILRLTIKKTKNDRLTYIDESVGWTRIRELLRKNIFKGNTKLTEHNLIRLSKKERKYLFQQIEAYKDFKWNENLFPNSIKIKKDSMWSYISWETNILREKQKNAILSKDTIALKEIKKELPRVYGFSKPIFIRNNSICLLYHFSMCGNPCGHYEINFYKKENGKWIKWIEMARGEY